MKKVAFVIHSLDMGGAERVVSELANNFSTKKLKVFIILFCPNKPYFKLDSRISLIHLPLSRSIIKRLFFLRKIIIVNGITTIISFTTTINIYSILATFFTSKKIIISERTDPVAHKLSFMKLFLRKLLYRYVHKLVVQNKAQFEYYLKNMSIRKLILIPNPVKKIDHTFSFENNVNVISVGRLVQSKNHLELIKCFLASKIECKLFIVGDGDQRNKISNFIKENNLEYRIKLLGSKKNIYNYLNPNWIFASTSLYEGFPNALIEAMSAGLNCIHYNCPSGINEIIENDINGYLVPLNDRKFFTQKLKDVFSNLERRILISKNAKITAKNFNIEKIANQWHQIL